MLEEYDYNCNYIYVSMLIKVTDEKILIYMSIINYIYMCFNILKVKGDPHCWIGLLPLNLSHVSFL